MVNGTSSFIDALTALENALTAALNRVTAVGTPEQILSLTRLLIKKEIVMELLLEEIGGAAASAPAYGNFWSSVFEVIPFGSPFTFNHSSSTAGGVSLVGTNTVSIVEAGDYRVSYIVTVDALNTPFPQVPVVSVFLNNVKVPNTQTTFGLVNPDPQDTGCYELVGEAIITVPANSTLQLRNDSFFNNQNIATCDNGINAVEFTVIKVS
jgi:hypothetical protein